MSSHIEIEGIRAKITNSKLGQGGQGLAQKAVLVSDPGIPLVVKSQPQAKKNHVRAKMLTAYNLPSLSPYLAGPIAMTTRNGQVLHLAPFAGGKDVETDRPRTFPELIEICHHLSCQWCVLEEQGLAHGDIAPSNVIVGDDGSTSLIDFDNFASLDPKVPAATMAGQAMMTAPEIRLQSRPPSIDSDRFAYAVLFNLILLRRHPSDGLATNPKELSSVMTTGRWPERVRKPQRGETPFGALGDHLTILFDTAFSVAPTSRPSADQWRRSFAQALQSIFIHDCGEAFIRGKGQIHCPCCQGALGRGINADTSVFKVSMPSLGTKYSFALKDGESIFLGRNNLGQGAASVSNRHIAITRFNQKLHLRHIGRHPSAIYRDGSWYNLNDVWVEKWEYEQAGVLIRLADLDVHLGL